MAGSLLRTESALGLMARMAASAKASATSLVHSTWRPVDDVGRNVKRCAGWDVGAPERGRFACAEPLHHRCQSTDNQRGRCCPVHGLGRHCLVLDRGRFGCHGMGRKASSHLMADPAGGSSMLERVGKALLAIDRQNWPLNVR